MRFVLNGCDISFMAEAPADITLEQLLKQCDRIKPDWCACGIRSCYEDEKNWETELIIDYDDVKKANDDVPCEIKESEHVIEKTTVINIGDECMAYFTDGRLLGKVVVLEKPTNDNGLYSVVYTGPEADFIRPGMTALLKAEQLKSTGRRIEYRMIPVKEE